MGASGKHRPILTRIASRPACLRGTGEEVRVNGGNSSHIDESQPLGALGSFTG